jgi:hypothetical protein
VRSPSPPRRPRAGRGARGRPRREALRPHVARAPRARAGVTPHPCHSQVRRRACSRSSAISASRLGAAAQRSSSRRTTSRSSRSPRITPRRTCRTASGSSQKTSCSARTRATCRCEQMIGARRASPRWGQPAPWRWSAPARSIAATTIVTHSPMFHQIEGFLVDEHVSIAELKGVLTAFAERLYGPGTPVRFRPSYFPFVEPGAEVDVGCVFCVPNGRRPRRVVASAKATGWLEIARLRDDPPRGLPTHGHRSGARTRASPSASASSASRCSGTASRTSACSSRTTRASWRNSDDVARLSRVRLTSTPWLQPRLRSCTVTFCPDTVTSASGPALFPRMYGEFARLPPGAGQTGTHVAAETSCDPPKDDVSRHRSTCRTPRDHAARRRGFVFLSAARRDPPPTFVTTFEHKPKKRETAGHEPKVSGIVRRPRWLSSW